MSEPMDSEKINDLIMEFRTLGLNISLMKDRRRQIADSFPSGRTEGFEYDFCRTADARTSRIDVDRLRRYVSQSVIDSCKVYGKKKGFGRIANKLRRKAEKIKECSS